METLVIKFNEAEIAFLRELTDAIQHHKVSRGIKTKNITSISDWDVQYIGLKGEAAVAKLLGLKIDRRVMDGGDDGRDLFWRGRTIQVKASFPAQTLHLLINDSNSLKCDYLVSVVTDKLTSAARIHGWIKTVDFLQSATIKNMGYGDRMALPIDKLHPIATLGENADDDLLWDDVASKRRDIVITPEFFDTWQERSAIMENDGKVSRARADLESFKELTTRRKK
jgi:uncharacterized protein YunC (DUF1805 family)